MVAWIQEREKEREYFNADALQQLIFICRLVRFLVTTLVSQSRSGSRLLGLYILRLGNSDSKF